VTNGPGWGRQDPEGNRRRAARILSLTWGGLCIWCIIGGVVGYSVRPTIPAAFVGVVLAASSAGLLLALIPIATAIRNIRADNSHDPHR
jgi:Kef-type K+ transport system membrane component KefB